MELANTSRPGQGSHSECHVVDMDVASELTLVQRQADNAQEFLAFVAL